MTDQTFAAGLAATEAECAAGRTAPRVSLDDIRGNIAGEYFNTADKMFPDAPILPGMELLTVCILVPRNGFTIIGKSAPASRDNFDPVLGAKLAHEDAVRQVWPLMGYELRERLHREEQTEKFERMDAEMGHTVDGAKGQIVPGNQAGVARTDEADVWLRQRALELGLTEGDPHLSIARAKAFLEFLQGVEVVGVANSIPDADKPPHMQRMVAECDELRDRVAKLQAFMDGEKFADLSEEAQADLVDQRTHMLAYLERLTIRIFR